MDTLLQDLRFAARTLLRNPGFTATAALTLALAIGAGAAMFSALDGVLLQDLPVRDEDEVRVLWTEAASGASDHLPVTQGELLAFRERTRAFESVAGVAYQGAVEATLRDAGRPLTATGTWVTGNYFPTLDVAPVHGRTLLPSDDVPGAAPVMVIGYGFWQRHFGGDPGAVGHRLELFGKPYTVVGVLPRGFEYPSGAEFWVPVFAAFPEEARKSSSGYVIYDLVARLRRGASPQDAREDYATFLREGDAHRPAAFRGMRPVLTPLREAITGDARAPLWTAAAAVGLLLLIACVNVANLLLVRGSARTHEFAIRRALGAGRPRLIRQLLTESVGLALMGGVLGVLLAVWAVDALVQFAPPELPRREMVGIDARVLLFAVATTGAAALLSGLLPAVLAAAGDPGRRLRGGGRAASPNRGTQALRHGLVVGQVSLAILVVAAAGLLVRSLIALQSVDMGFDEERLLVAQTALPAGAAPERDRQVQLMERMLERVRAIPGVAGATTLPSRPFSGPAGWIASYTGDGQSEDAQATNPMLNLEVVDPAYFRTLDIPIRRGRAFTARDREDAPRVAIVSDAVARHTWPGENPIGKRIKLGAPDGPGEWHTVVGVVEVTRYRALADPMPSIYLPSRQFAGPVPMNLAVRTRTDPAAVVPQIRRALQEIHADWVLTGGGSIRQLMAAPLARPRFSAFTLGAFAALTLLLAAVGLYGVLVATVRQRTREIGIRLALGARAGAVARGVARQGVLLVAVAIPLGLAAALAASRLLGSLLFGVSPTDPLTLAVVSALLLAVALLASWLPARRAARTDPLLALREE